MARSAFISTDLQVSIPDTPLDMLSRIFAVAELVEKAKTQIEDAKEQRQLVEKTQVEEAIVS
jgi:hypothetical protein